MKSCKVPSNPAPLPPGSTGCYRVSTKRTPWRISKGICQMVISHGIPLPMCQRCFFVHSLSDQGSIERGGGGAGWEPPPPRVSNPKRKKNLRRVQGCGTPPPRMVYSYSNTSLSPTLTLKGGGRGSTSPNQQNWVRMWVTIRGPPLLVDTLMQIVNGRRSLTCDVLVPCGAICPHAWGPPMQTCNLTSIFSDAMGDFIFCIGSLNLQR